MADEIKWLFFAEGDPTTGGGRVEVTVSVPSDCVEDPESRMAFTEGLGTWLGMFFDDRFSVLKEGTEEFPRMIGSVRPKSQGS